MSDIRQFFIQAGSYQIAAIEYGDPNGQPVLALHGWLDNAASFYLLGEKIKGVRFIALDLVGHGFSDFRPAPMPYHIWDNVDDLYQIISSLGLKKVSLVGHSMGASIAMLFAAAFPDKVERLMFIDGLSPLAYEENSLPELFADALVKRSKMAGKALQPYSLYDDALKARMNGRWPVPHEAATALLERGLVERDKGYFWRNDPKLMMPSLVRFSPGQISAFIRAIKSEAIVIRASEGAADTIIDPWLSDFRNVKVIDMLGSHHLHLEQAPAAKIAEIINTWE